MNKILITGSFGVIGSALCKRFVENGIVVVPFDIKEGVDICDKEQLQQAMREVDVIIHCAAVSRVCNCEQDKCLCRKVNVDGTKNLIECAEKQRNNPYILFCSSREVYGNSAILPVTEDMRYNPLNEYARSKVEAEKIIIEETIKCCIL